MRIVAGEFGGRTIKSPSEATTRPTTDRVREAMFSSILSRLDEWEGTRILDAFGGSGALGLEGLSRGADSCLFYEQDQKAKRILEGNVASLGAKSRAMVRGGDVLKAADRPLSGGVPFGLVTLDPPYAMDSETVLGFLRKLLSNGDLADDVVIVYEHSADRMKAVAALLDQDEDFSSTGQKKYGKIAITYMTRKEG